MKDHTWAANVPECVDIRGVIQKAILSGTGIHTNVVFMKKLEANSRKYFFLKTEASETEIWCRHSSVPAET